MPAAYQTYVNAHMALFKLKLYDFSCKHIHAGVSDARPFVLQTNAELSKAINGRRHLLQGNICISDSV